MRVAVNFRFSEGVTNQYDNEEFTTIDMVTYDLGIGVGRSGFFSIGYGTPSSDYYEGYMCKVGLGFDILSLAPTGGKSGRFGLTLGIEGEFASGSTTSIQDNRADVKYEDGNIYGGAVTLRLVEVFYMGIGYGFISSDEISSKGNYSLKGNYTNFIVGLNIPF